MCMSTLRRVRPIVLVPELPRQPPVHFCTAHLPWPACPQSQPCAGRWPEPRRASAASSAAHQRKVHSGAGDGLRRIRQADGVYSMHKLKMSAVRCLETTHAAHEQSTGRYQHRTVPPLYCCGVRCGGGGTNLQYRQYLWVGCVPLVLGRVCSDGINGFPHVRLQIGQRRKKKEETQGRGRG